MFGKTNGKKGKTSSAKYLTYVHGSRKPVYVVGGVNDIDEKGIKSIGTVKLVTGILLCLLFAALVLMVFTEFIFPFFVSGGASVSSGTSAVSELSSEEVPEISGRIEYDSETGLEIFSDEFNLFIINSDSPVEENFSPELGEIDGVKVNENIVPALRMLIEDAADAGVGISLRSGYVSYGDQKKLFDKEVARLIKAGETSVMANHDAAKTVAPPGEADEETGLSVKLKGSAASFTESNVYNWLNNNAAEYGFVFRYPDNKSTYTGKTADYTVLRYVGKDNAIKMRQLSMCLEEYVSYVG